MKGYYLRPQEREKMEAREGEEVKVAWKKISNSKCNTVDPQVHVTVS